MIKVVIDTSAWIEAFRPGCEPELADMVKRLLGSGSVLLPGLVKAELLRGTKTRTEFNRLKDLLEGLTYVPLSKSFWDELADFSFTLFRKGATVPLVDTAIALTTIQNDAALLHRDRHFDMIAEKTPLKLFQ
jgi:predicted nucleic acid-binding protein